MQQVLARVEVPNNSGHHADRVARSTAGRARFLPRGRLPFAFGPRFFVALLLGLVWMVPAWWTPRLLLSCSFGTRLRLPRG